MPGVTPRTFSALDIDVDVLRKAATTTGVSVSVCIPARDEEATIGDIVRVILDTCGGLVSEVLVVDDRSSDATAAFARAAGAVVVAADDVLPECGPASGKGEALWKSVAASTGDLIVWCDGDVREFDPRFVIGLVGPLLMDDSVDFVKGFYEREGGRVTELVARPIIGLLHPHLAGFAQPLAGEYAGRRALLERLPFASGYGVDLALLIDVAAEVGLDRMAQVDLGVRVHRNRPLDELAPQATEVMRAALDRAGVTQAGRERPPLVDVPGYRRQTA